MAVETDWAVPGRVIYAHLYGEVTTEDLESYGRFLRNALEEGTPPMHLITDGYGIVNISEELEVLESAINVLSHPGLEWTIVCDASNPVFRYLTRILSKAAGAKFRLVKDRDEAREFLLLQDSSLEFVP